MLIIHLLPQRSEEEWGEDLRSERIRKRLLNNQLESGERNNKDDDPTFADPDHAVEDNEEEEAKTVKATTAVPPVETAQNFPSEVERSLWCCAPS